jgi:hypothetical protein
MIDKRSENFTFIKGNQPFLVWDTYNVIKGTYYKKAVMIPIKAMAMELTRVLAWLPSSVDSSSGFSTSVFMMLSQSKSHSGCASL